MPPEGLRMDVLVVDDEPVVCDGIRKILGAEGFRVESASDAASALAHPALAGCRLVLCDLKLPDRSGIDVLREIHRRRPDLPVVLITGYATPDQAAQAYAAGAIEFLPKPFEASELLFVVQRALGSEGNARKEVLS